MNPDVPRVPRMYHVCDTRMCVVMCDSWKFPLIPTNFRRVSTIFAEFSRFDGNVWRVVRPRVPGCALSLSLGKVLRGRELSMSN